MTQESSDEDQRTEQIRRKMFPNLVKLEERLAKEKEENK